MAGPFSGTFPNMTVTGVLSALLIGIIVGTLGRLVLPGRQSIGVISTVAIGIGAAFLGTWVARMFGVEDVAPARLDLETFGWHFSWSWAEFGVQVLVAVIGVALAAALTNTVVADNYRQRRNKRRVRS